MPVVDASIIVDLVAPDVASGNPAELLVASLTADGAEILAPALIWLECSNALLTGIRRGRWNGEAADRAFAALDSIPIVPSDAPKDRERAFELARRYDNWPVYDMVYVALAERLGTEFYTADDRLRTRLAHLPWVLGLDGAG
ncbi:MAG: type II toxin-antitoxin system VapC family toxin [Nocardiopsaceae bacterium]|nr:type II toxin-antitoxin system VapC family toxin [Nocardiopsaceae bacterium]